MPDTIGEGEADQIARRLGVQPRRWRAGDKRRSPGVEQALRRGTAPARRLPSSNSTASEDREA